jgi:hypothetical protein
VATPTKPVEIEEPLLVQVEQAASRLHTSADAFIQAAIEGALKRHQRRELEKQDQEGYARIPQSEEEAEEWAVVQAWPD